MIHKTEKYGPDGTVFYFSQVKFKDDEFVVCLSKNGEYADLNYDHNEEIHCLEATSDLSYKESDRLLKELCQRIINKLEAIIDEL